MFLAAVILAANFFSANREMCVVIDSESKRGALYRRMPSGNGELISEFALQRLPDRVLVADDGSFVAFARFPCSVKSEVLTIHRADGSIVRTFRGGDLVTRDDQIWLCRSWDDLSFSFHDDFGDTKLRMTVKGEKEVANIDVDLTTGEAPKPEKSYFEPSVSIGIESELLHRVVTRVEPEYPEVAMKARIAGRVIAEVTVGPDGRVTETRITKPLPFGLDQSVKEALSEWTFEPDETTWSGSLVVRFELLRSPPLKVTTVHCSFR